MNFFLHNINYISKESLGGNSYSLIFMLLFFLLFFYFVLFRPQQKKDQERKKIIDSLTIGDEVITTSGLIGRINKVRKSGYVVLQLNYTTEVLIKKDFILSVLPKGTLKNLQ